MGKHYQCTYCGKDWNVSVLIDTSPYSYECPRCEKNRKRALRNCRSKRAHKK